MFYCGFTIYNCFCYLDCTVLNLWWKVLPYFPFPFSCVTETSDAMLSAVVSLHFLDFFFFFLYLY